MKQYKPSIGKIIAVTSIGLTLSACMLYSSIFQHPTAPEKTSTISISTPYIVLPKQTPLSQTSILATQTLPTFTPSPEPTSTLVYDPNYKLTIGDAFYDQFDSIIMASIKKYGLNQDIGMVVKAMIHEESNLNPFAISRYDKILPCGTHSYGLMQITPGCNKSFAILPEGTMPTAEIFFGLDGIPALLNYYHNIDQKKGITILKENGLIINLITNKDNPLYITSAFNPAYNIDSGVRALSNSIDYMKERFICSDEEYLVMSLAGYNAGKKNVIGCLDYNEKGQNYIDNIIKEYRRISKLAEIKPNY